jgi:hypothetical protein
LEALRHAYTTFLRSDYIEIIEDTLRRRATVGEAARSMGMSEEGGRKLLHEALLRLSEFVDESKDQGVLEAGSENATTNRTLFANRQ